MNDKLKYWLGVSLFFGVIALSMNGWSFGPPGGMHANPARMIVHISEQLELSPEQQSEVESLVSSAREATATDHQRMRELHAQMVALRADFDPAEARQIADEIGQITGRLVYEASATWSQVYRLLDTQQRAELDSLVAKRREHRGKWHERGEQPSQ